MTTIKDLRQQIRVARRAVDPQICEQKSSTICQRIIGLDSYQSACRIAAYLAFDGEADPMELMADAVDQNKQIYLPIIVGKSKPLVFAPWTPSTPMVKNRFNIMEPQVAQTEWISADQLDFVINPLVAFDERCNRIGVGGGFYDRTFAFANEPRQASSVQLIGAAFELQKLPSIQPKEWDVRLDAVATESRVYRLDE